LDEKPLKCIFLEYVDNELAYQLWDPLKRRVIGSRDVIFNEEQVLAKVCTMFLKFKNNKKISHHYKKTLLEIMSSHCNKIKTRNKKKKKINNSKINIHQEKSCHKIDQFPGLSGHIGLRKGIPLRMYFID
jgi:hypothetical protein